ncbi:MAG: sterol desaturase family protein [Verrucomicrobia subdivision 3 bacterium]|nr:sterol desaturase family protein [Limisphaerales bacterium]
MNGWSNEMLRSTGSAAVLVVLLTWESLAPFFAYFAGAARERIRHGLRNVALGVVNATVNGFICVGLWWLVARWAEDHQVGLLHWARLPAWAHLAGVFVLVDLWMYVWHRLNHRVPFLWRFHRVHHSDPKVDVTTANRFHLGEIVLSCMLRVPVIALVGVRLWELALYEAAMFAVVQLHHANISLPARLDRWLRMIIVTPFMHKVHHSNWQPETDSNYSSLFSFWDRVFRTFRLRKDPHSLCFGLDELRAAEHQTLGGLLATPARNIQRTPSKETSHEPPLASRTGSRP